MGDQRSRSCASRPLDGGLRDQERGVNPAADLVDIFIFQGVTVGAFVQIINMRDIGPWEADTITTSSEVRRKRTLEVCLLLAILRKRSHETKS